MFNFTFPWEGGNLSRRKEANSYLWHIFLLTVSQDSNKASSLLPALSSILFRTSVCYLTSSFWSNVTGPAFSSKQSVWIRTLYFHNSEVKNAMAIDLQWSLPSFFSLGSWRHADFTCHFFFNFTALGRKLKNVTHWSSKTTSNNRQHGKRTVFSPKLIIPKTFYTKIYICKWKDGLLYQINHVGFLITAIRWSENYSKS